MKKVEIPVVLIVFIIVVLAIVAYLADQSNRIAENLVSNDQLKLENENLSLKIEQKQQKLIDKFSTRRTIGFKV